MSRRSLCLLIVCLSAAPILAEAPVGPDGEALTLDELRQALEDYGYESAEAYYVGDAYGGEIVVGPINERYEWLLDPALAEWVAGLRDAAVDPAEARALGYLAWDIEAGLLWEPLEDYYIAILEAEARGVIEFEGEEIAYRDVWEAIDELEEDERRDALRDAARAFVREELQPRRAAYLEALRAGCRELGYADYVDYYARNRGRDFAQLAADCLYILGRTRELYVTLAEERVAAVYPGRERLSLTSLERWRLWDDDEFDAYFGAAELVPAWEDFIGGLEVGYDSLDNITLDDEDRPAKEPRAACWPMRVPEDVRVLVKPTGGFEDYQTLFHEMGHACHFAYTDPGLPYELRELGDDAITETYAFLFENLFENPLYLDAGLEIPADEARELRRRQLFSELSGLRYYCMAFLYELALHGVEADHTATYKELVDMTSIWSHEPEDYLTGVFETNEDFYTTNYLYAWMLEAQLRRRLEEDFGPAWWREPAAGARLVELWRRGYVPTPANLSAELGYEECSPRELVELLEEQERATRP
jgi:hypothetical protein